MCGRRGEEAMVNHLNTDQATNESISFCKAIFGRISGRARVRLNGVIAGFDSNRKEVFVDSYTGDSMSMPAGLFMQHLSREEIAKLENGPEWDRSNEIELNTTLLGCVSSAIRR
jgi:hypothetical protein